MKKLILFLTCCLSLSCFANTYYFVELTDKKATQFTSANPIEYLSQKALDRRAKWNIQIEENDLPVSNQYIQLIKQTGAQVTLHSKWLNGVIAITETTAQIEAIEALDCVKETRIIKEMNTLSKKRKKRKHTKCDFIPQTPYGKAYIQANMIGANFLHQNGFKGDDMVIAILDAGFTGVDIATGFDSLRNHNAILGGYDFVDLDQTYYHGSEHGTRVLSCISGNIPNTFIGTAPNCSVYLFRTEDVNTEWPIEMYNWIAAVERCDSLGVDLITSSLGYYAFDNENLSIPYEDLDGNTCPNTIVADLAVKKGIMMVNSAGNEARKEWKYIVTPCDAKNILSIGAVTPDGDHASFSSLGPSADGRTKPDVMALGGPAITFNEQSNPNSSNGTSFACPITAGMVTCLMQAFPNVAPISLVEILRQTASLNNTPTDKMGFGIANAKLAYKWIKDGTGLDNNECAKNGDFYPNPSHHLLYFMPNKQPSSVQIFDLSGKQLFNISANSIPHIDISYLQKGAYIVSYKINNKLNTASFIKD